MCEYLFRGKTKDGKWVYGFVLNAEHTLIGYYKNSHDFCIIEVIPETVGEYTGLCDKNGNKIFEGDIVSHKEGYGEIVYDQDRAMYNIEFDGLILTFDHIYSYELEVIGNIHDNPELLED